MANTQSQTTAASLAKAINTLELGNQRILTETGSISLSGAGVGSAGNNLNEYELDIATYLGLMNTYFNGSLREIDGVQTFVTKDRIAFSDATSYGIGPGPRVISKRFQRIVPPKYHGNYICLLVDINGSSSPNKLAKDQFILFIDNFGAIIPYGGAEYSSYTARKNRSTPEAEVVIQDPEWLANCNTNQTPNSEDDSALASCTGSIVDNGFKVVYAQ